MKPNIVTDLKHILSLKRNTICSTYNPKDDSTTIAFPQSIPSVLNFSDLGKYFEDYTIKVIPNADDLQLVFYPAPQWVKDIKEQILNRVGKLVTEYLGDMSQRPRPPV